MQVCKSGEMEGICSRAFGNRLANEFIVDDMIFFFLPTSNFLLILFPINLVFHDQ